MTKKYSLRKCRKLLTEALLRHKKLAKRLSGELLAKFDRSLDALALAIQNKDIQNANLHAYDVEQFLHEHGRKTIFEHVREFCVAVTVALIIAAIVRMMWFELYEIPSGSMRPTFRESDRVLVFKDVFCINKPFETAHFYFDPHLVERGSIVVLTGDKLDLPDVDTTYFGLFPGKRRYVKRCVAKDGDTIYFYGGNIYGIDKEGKERVTPYLSPYEYIPFITFEGKVEESKKQDTNRFTLRHMNIPVATVDISAKGMSAKPIGEMPPIADLWGIGNFAMSRILEPEDLPSAAKILGYTDPDAKLYLEIKHSPQLPTNRGEATSLLHTELSWIGLDDTHVERIKQALYTGRFYVRKGTGFRYTPEGPDLQSQGVFLDRKIPDGCYEFIDGVAYEVGFGAITHPLPATHPLYPHTLKAVKALYNSGIEFSSITNKVQKTSYFPARYSYFRDGGLYTLGKPLFVSGDPKLARFVEREGTRQSQQKGYKAFRDHGPPVKDGKLDVEFIRTFGLPIAENHYLLLGDNHAMSNDSRFFGAVPQQNLQGSPSLLFWPPGSRWGRPPQPELPLFRIPNVVVDLSAAVIIAIAYTIYNRRLRRKPSTHKKAGV